MKAAALVAIGFMLFTGAFAWLGLWQFRRLARVPNWNLAVILILTLVSFGLMARASNIGGEIRHAEIRAGQGNDSHDRKARWRAPWARSLPNPVDVADLRNPAFHRPEPFVGVVFLVDLRVLGVMKGVSFASLHRLLPWAALGFGVNVVTGMLFFVGIPGQYIHNAAFYWKIGLVMLAGANALYFTLLDEPWSLGPGEDAPLTAKIAAVSAMLLWIAVMYCGSMLPFLGNSF